MKKIISIIFGLYKYISLKFLYAFFKEHIHNCTICHSNNTSNYFKSLYYFNKLKIDYCHDCQIKFQNPMLNDKGLKYYYSYIYRVDYLFKSLNKLFEREKRRGDYIIDYLKENNLKCKNQKVLEIGSGCGGILYQFKNNENNIVEGIDLDEKTIRFGINKKINLETNSIENYKTTTKFDIIILSHVIEHIYDLKNFFKLLKNFTHKSTFIYIEVPGLENERVKKRKYSLQPGHLYYFDQNNLSIFFKNNGLRIISQNNIIQMVLEYEE